MSYELIAHNSNVLEGVGQKGMSNGVTETNSACFFPQVGHLLGFPDLSPAFPDVCH